MCVCAFHTCVRRIHLVFSRHSFPPFPKPRSPPHKPNSSPRITSPRRAACGGDHRLGPGPAGAAQSLPAARPRAAQKSLKPYAPPPSQMGAGFNRGGFRWGVSPLLVRGGGPDHPQLTSRGGGTRDPHTRSKSSSGVLCRKCFGILTDFCPKIAQNGALAVCVKGQQMLAWTVSLVSGGCPPPLDWRRV